MNSFRVYDNKENKYVKGLFLTENCIPFVIDWHNHDVDELDPNRYIVEFSTGLFDKNNNEIYVGDIIRCGDVDSIITFSDGSFQMITSENQGRSPMLQDRTKRFIIVGNIHNKDI